MYKVSGIVYCLRGCSNDIARAVGVVVVVTYFKFIEFIPIVIIYSFSSFSISYNKLLRSSFEVILEDYSRPCLPIKKFPARVATGTIR